MSNSSKAIVYHFWSDYNPLKLGGSECTTGSTRNPILLSAAIARAQNPTIPIYLLDIGKNVKESEYTERINLKIVHWNYHLKPFQVFTHLTDWETKLFSRLFDLHRFDDTIPEQDIVYTDSDVFWLQAADLRGNTDRFCWNGWNSGFFYYNKTKNKLLFDLVDAYGITGMVDRNITLKHLLPACKYKPLESILNDEILLHYLEKNYSKLFHRVRNEEHHIVRNWLTHKEFALQNYPLMIHCNGFENANRGLLTLYFNEFRESLLRIFKEEELAQIFNVKRLPPVGVSFKDVYNDVDYMSNFLNNHNVILSTFLKGAKCILM